MILLVIGCVINRSDALRCSKAKYKINSDRNFVSECCLFKLVNPNWNSNHITVFTVVDIEFEIQLVNISY